MPSENLNDLMNELLEVTKAWPEQARVNYIQAAMAREYAKIQSDTETAYVQAWEAKYGRPKSLQN
jgi:hypothetical protein